MDKTLVFVCIGNSCRSQIAEAIARSKNFKNLKIESAGVHPAGFIAENTISILKENKLETKNPFSKGFDMLPFKKADYLVILDKRIECSVFPHKTCIKWDIEDPIGMSIKKYRKIFKILNKKINDLLKSIKEELK